MAQDHNPVLRRTYVLASHLSNNLAVSVGVIKANTCLNYIPPEVAETQEFDTSEMRRLLDGHNLDDRDWLYGMIRQLQEFNPVKRGGRVYVLPDYNQSMEQQREMTMRRIASLLDRGVFKGWLCPTDQDKETSEWRKLALFEVIGMYDHSLAVKIGVHFYLWGGAIQFFGTKPHHDKWLSDTESYAIKGCFAMTELGHGSNVRGIETVTTYDPLTQEFVINTPCESAQKYWIGGAANHATHTVVFSQLHMEGKCQGVHAFICPIRDQCGDILPSIRISDCGHKIGLNGVDNGRLWFHNVRVPRENMLNSVADVTPEGKYVSSFKDADQRFAAFLAPLTSGRVTIAASSVYQSKIALTIAIRYSLTRRAFSPSSTEEEVLLLDYPSHQRRLLPLLAKTYAMSFAANYLKLIYVRRSPQSIKSLHVISSAYKATLTWENMKTLQECREACGGQGLKTENRIGNLHSEFDVQSTFEGDNNVLMQQVSKALFSEYVATQKKKKPFTEFGLEHLNKPRPQIPSQFTSRILRGNQFQMDALCLRETDLLERFVKEVMRLQAEGESINSSFLKSHQLAEDLGRAFADRSILKCFTDAEESVPDASLKDVLGMMRSLYALTCIEDDMSFLRYGYISVDNAAAVRSEVARLCGEARCQALPLVNSFGIPDAFLSPLAHDWLHANSLQIM